MARHDVEGGSWGQGFALTLLHNWARAKATGAPSSVQFRDHLGNHISFGYDYSDEEKDHYNAAFCDRVTWTRALKLWRDRATGTFSLAYPSGLVYGFSVVISGTIPRSRLEYIEDVSGNRMSLEYASGAEIRLLRVNAPDGDGRWLEFEYNGNGL